jgi:hypothetical protein
MFTAKQVRQILNDHNGVFPATPDGYFDPEEYRTPIMGETYWNRRSDKVLTAGGAFKPSMSPDLDPALILKPKPKRYRFICDDPAPRVPVMGEWWVRTTTYETNSADTFIEVTGPNETFAGKLLVFRREEIAD